MTISCSWRRRTIESPFSFALGKLLRFLGAALSFRGTIPGQGCGSRFRWRDADGQASTLVRSGLAPAARAHLRSHAEKLGLRVACIADTRISPQIWSIATFRIANSRSGTYRARRNGAGFGMRPGEGFYWYEHPSAMLDAQSKMVVESLRECAERSAELGVTIGVQNHHDIACDFESLYELIREVNAPNCRAMFDAWAPALQGVDLESAAAKMAGDHGVYNDSELCGAAPFSVSSHAGELREAVATVQAVPVDEGFIELPVFSRAARKGRIPWAGSL